MVRLLRSETLHLIKRCSGVRADVLPSAGQKHASIWSNVGDLDTHDHV
jgi:hypothetical protein